MLKMTKIRNDVNGYYNKEVLYLKKTQKEMEEAIKKDGNKFLFDLNWIVDREEKKVFAFTGDAQLGINICYRIEQVA